ncbi:MAG: hypothetical protein JHC26_04620 [Thermofilum sp.]|jgi:hypothetical protein|uniref:hypothetical protein n=1 Tax=Thermofilum sp. TaxID=1961369 RepID=UPI0025863C74|nr:hypothetical protein [Thermofilum sp.]MCI4408351.1 hypothetical protein [Thermofilum sp.]
MISNTFHPIIHDLLGRAIEYFKSASIAMPEITPPEDSDEKQPTIPRIFRDAFGFEGEDLQKYLNDLVTITNKYFGEYGRNLLSTFTALLEFLRENQNTEEAYKQYSQKLSAVLQPLIFYYDETLKNFKQIGQIVSRRSITYGYMIAKTLEEIEKDINKYSKYSENFVAFDANEPIHIRLVWAHLSDYREALIPKISGFDNKVDKIRKYLSDIAQNLIGKVALHDAISDYNPNNIEPLSKMISGTVKDIETELAKKEIGILNNYIIQHIKSFAENYHSPKNQKEKTIKSSDIDTYLDITFIQNGFLEYEAYNAFVMNGFFALPRILVYSQGLNEEGKNISVDTELDLVAQDANYDQLSRHSKKILVIEVTSRSYQDDVNKKADKIKNLLDTQIGKYISKVIFIGKSNLSLEDGDKIIHLSYSDLYSGLRDKISNNLTIRSEALT